MYFSKLIVVVSLLSFGVIANAQIITTIAGTGVVTYVGDGSPATAINMRPTGIALDASGNIFITEEGQYRVRKITPSSIVTTYAGNGVSGYSGDGGLATHATFGSDVYSLATDGAGNVYISDFDHHCVRKIDVSGIITTYAGNGSFGHSGDGGPAASAQLNNPWQIATDKLGNLFIADCGNNCVRKVSTSGIITTVAGTGVSGFSGDGGPATLATFNNPKGLTVDDSGNIYISDRFNYRIRKVNSAGIVSTVVGNGSGGFSGDGGPAMSAQIQVVNYLAVDKIGNLYLSDLPNARVRKVNKAGIITTVAGIGGTGPYSGDGGPATSAEIISDGITVDCAGNLYIASASRIRKVTHINNTPIFTGGATQHKSICRNTSVSISSWLSTMDIDTAQEATWNVLSAASHGTVATSFSTVTTGGTIMPSGLTYTPVTGYVGADSFAIQVSDCAGAADTTHIYVQIDSPALAATVSGIDSLCPGDTSLLMSSASSGTWSSSNPSLATVSGAGVVTAHASGTVTISYTITNGCGSISTAHAMFVRPTSVCPSGITPVSVPDICIVPNPTANGSFTILAPAMAAATATMTITDITGRVLTTTTIPSNSYQKLFLDAPHGFYFITVTTAEYAISKKLYN